MEIEGIRKGAPVFGIDAMVRAADAVAHRTLINAVQAANKSELFGQDRELSFARDAETKKLLIQIKDRKTGEVVQQIPPRQLLEMIRNQRLAGRTRSNE